MAEEKEVPQQSAVDPQSYWEEKVKELESGGGNQFLFLKADKTRLRFLGEGHPETFSRAVDSVYQEKKSQKFIVMGFEVKVSDDPPELRAIVLPKTAWQQVCGLQAEGYDLFTVADGLGVVITKQNSGGRISYQVMPAPRKVQVPPDIVQEWAEADWALYEKAFAVMQDSKQGSTNSTPRNDNTNDVAQQIIDGAGSTKGEEPW